MAPYCIHLFSDRVITMLNANEKSQLLAALLLQYNFEPMQFVVISIQRNSGNELKTPLESQPASPPSPW